MESYELDIIIPVYNEGENISQVLDRLGESVKTSFRVLICYDRDDDNTLPIVYSYPHPAFGIMLVKNEGLGVHGAVITGFRKSTAPAVLVFPADDTYNAGIIDHMYEKFQQGCDIVAASRFVEGGCMKRCYWLKSLLVKTASFTLYQLAGIPVHDATNGFRLFSKRIIRDVPIESRRGFAFSLELLVKCHHLGRKVGEVPAVWFGRTKGKSRFRIAQWLVDYVRWYIYAFATRFCKMKFVRLQNT